MAEGIVVEAGILRLDSVTRLDPGARGLVLIAASHGGVYPAHVAAAGGARAVILSDAGVGLEEAGIGGLAYLAAIGMAAAAVDYRSARIGDGGDLAARGLISHVNGVAAGLGVVAGQGCLEAARRLRAAPMPRAAPPELAEARHPLRMLPGEPKVWALDSNSLVGPADAGQIVVTGSHGGLLGGRPETAIKAACLAAVYNDAGVGIDQAGISRLPALDRRGIAGATVGAASARIGDARSTWATGILSHVNAAAEARGGRPGMTVPDFIAALIDGDRAGSAALLSGNADRPWGRKGSQ